MPAIEPLCRLLRIDIFKLPREEVLILEAEIFIRLYKELNEIFRSQYKEYFNLMKFNREMEDAMLEAEFIKNITKDLVTMGEYSLAGIAYHTHIPEEVIREIALGNNTNPSLRASRKIIELHRIARFNLYHDITKKIITQYMEERVGRN